MKYLPLVLVLAISTACNHFSREKTGLEGTSLPSFKLFLADSATHFNTSDIPSGKPIVLFFFGPYCPYSRAEMQEIVANMGVLNNVQFFVFTTARFPDMKTFYNYFQLEKYPNVTAGVDYTNFFPDYFKAQGVPYIAVYDKNKRLKEVLEGKTDIKELKDLVLE